MNKAMRAVKEKSSEELRRLLGQHPFFQGMAPGNIEVIAHCANYVMFNSGENIFLEGDASSAFYAILRGKVVLQTQSGRGTITLEVLESGTVLGWSWLLPPYKKQLDAAAIEDVECIQIDGACIRAACEQDPKFGYELVKRFAAVIGERLQATRVRLMNHRGEW